MENIIEKRKFKKFRERLGYSQTSLASKLGIATGSIGMIEAETEKNKNRSVTANIKMKIKEVFNIDFDVDIDSDGNILSKNNDNSSPNIVRIPFYSAVKAAAGSGVEIPNYPEQEVMTFDRRWLKTILGVNEKNVALINVEGDSMTPLINDGDLLMFDFSVKNVINNKVFIIEDEDKLRVKRLKQDFNGDIYLISDNKQYPPEKVTHPLNIVGKVVWNGSKENV